MLGIGISPYLRHVLLPDAISEDLAFYYKFDNAKRSYGTSNGGDSNVSYVSGNAVLTGLDSFIQIDPSPDFVFGGSDFTVYFKFSPSIINSDQQFLFGQSSYAGSNTSTALFAKISDTGKLEVWIKTTESAASFKTLTSTTTIVSGAVYLFTVKRSGTSLTLRLNGTVEDTDTINYDVNESIYKMSIGCLGEINAFNPFLSGTVSTFAGWFRALTVQEETDLYNGGAGWEFKSPSPVVSTNDLQTGFIDTNTIAFSTFASHSHKVIRNSHGWFVSYWKEYVSANVQVYVLAKSTDEGLTWAEIYSNNFYNHPPLIEADSDGNIYMINNDAVLTAKLLKFSAPDFEVPVQLASIAGLIAHKHAMILDEANDRIYYYVRNVFTVLQMDGTELDQVTLLQPGTTAGAEYPFFILHPTNGDLYFGWVTAVPDSNGDYKTIQLMCSRDLAVTWENLDGSSVGTLPIISDDTGPTQLLTLVGEISTNKFISGFTFANERLHIKYFLDDPTVFERYLRINPASGIVEITTDLIWPAGGVGGTGYTYDLYDGAFVKSETDGTAASPHPIYAFGTVQPKFQSIQTNDNGVTWTNFKECDLDLTGRRYSICAARETYNGKCYGVYTNIYSKPVPPAIYTDKYSGHTYFFTLDT